MPHRGTWPDYRATLQQHGWNAALFAPTAEVLLGKLAALDPTVPPPWDELPPLTPLV